MSEKHDDGIERAMTPDEIGDLKSMDDDAMKLAGS
jgi:hypothetical protein